MPMQLEAKTRDVQGICPGRCVRNIPFTVCSPGATPGADFRLGGASFLLSELSELSHARATFPAAWAAAASRGGPWPGLTRHVATVDHEGDAGDIGRFVAGEIDGGAGDVVRLSHPAQRSMRCEHRLWPVDEDTAQHGRVDEAGADAIDPDVLRSVLEGDGSAQPDDSGLGGR